MILSVVRIGEMFKFFISFAGEDVRAANYLRDYLTSSFSPNVTFVLSSRLLGGSRWEEELRKEARDATGVLLLLTPKSIDKRWINVEGGVFWAHNKTICPLLGGGITVQDLQPPFTGYTAVDIESEDGIRTLIKAIERECRIHAVPGTSATQCASELKSLLSPKTAFPSLESALAGIPVNTKPIPQILVGDNIVAETTDLITRIRHSHTLELAGAVADAGIVSIQFPVRFDPEFLVVEIAQSTFVKSYARRQFLKILVNNQPVLPHPTQRHWNDTQYIPLEDGYFIYELCGIRQREVTLITLVFWRVQIAALQLRFYFAESIDPLVASKKLTNSVSFSTETG